MPQDQSQLDSSFDYAKLPDGSFAKFKKGTSKEEMQAKLSAAGLLGKPALPPTQQPGMPAAESEYKRKAREKAGQNIGRVTYGGTSYPLSEPHPAYYGFTPSNIAGSIGRMAKEFGTSLIDTAKDLASNPNWFATQPEGQRPSTMQKFVTEPAMTEGAKAQELWRKGGLANRVEAGGRFLASGIPMIGPMIAGAGETAGRGDIGGAVGQATGLFLTGKVAKEGTGLVVDKATGMISPESLRMRAAKLNTELLKTADAIKGGKPGLKNYNLADGYRVAKEGIISNIKELPVKIEAKRVATDAKAVQLGRQLDAQGRTIDISKEVAQIQNEIKNIASSRGQWDASLEKQIDAEIKRVSTARGPTGAPTARDLTKMKISDAIELQKGLDKIAKFEKGKPEALSNLGRRLYGAIGDKIGGVSPELQKLRAAEHELINARDAAHEKYASILNGERKLSFMGIYRDIPTIGAYMLLRSTIGWMPAVGATLTLRAMAKSAVSTTARAALYAKAAEVIDAALGRSGGQQGPFKGGTPPQGPQGPSASTSPQGGPQATPAQRLAGAIGLQATAAPTTAPLQLPAPAAPPPTSGPTAASRAASEAAFAKNFPPEAMPETAGIDFTKAAKPIDTEAYARATEQARKELGPTAPKEAVLARRDEIVGERPETRDVGERARAKAGKEPTRAEVKAAAQARGSVAESTITPTRVAEGVSGIDPKQKAMLDRLDELTARQASPKSGAERNAIEREVAQIKRVLSGEEKGTAHKGDRKQIADRERLAAKRAEAKAASPGAVSTSATEAATSGVSPEQRASLLQMGYQKLATYESGPEMVKALQKQAQDLAKAGVKDFDEMSALTDALNVMKEIEGK
jgi:hypothetical protein